MARDDPVSRRLFRASDGVEAGALTRDEKPAIFRRNSGDRGDSVIMIYAQRHRFMSNVDFHCHSEVSDGLYPSREVVRLAAQNAVDVLALTDHDSLGGLADAREAANDLGVQFVDGVEVSVTWDGQTLHIIGVNIDPTESRLRQGLETIRSGRMKRAEKMAESLARVGIDGVLQGALSYAVNPNMIGRTHFARCLVEQGHVKDVKTVFKKYLVPGKPGYMPHEWASLTDAVDWIVGSGGIPVIAHPGRYDIGPNAMKRLLAEFKTVGGLGVEVVTSNHSKEQVELFARLAVEYDFFASRGSDFHGDENGRVQLGKIPPLPPQVKPVWSLIPSLN
jgi:predicted metal-dependent phosphoesterase TrpH